MGIVGRLGHRVANALGLQVSRAVMARNPYLELPAWAYQEPLVRDHIQPGQIVLDIGSGNFPSPRADILADFFPDDSYHRSGKIVETKPVIICSVERLPFRTGALDFAICSHVMEHVSSPARAASELSRCAHAGYLETPAYGKDILVGSGYMHKWQVVEFEGLMHFFEYSPRQMAAHVSSPVMELWTNPSFHPWQQFFWERQDLFNAWTVWRGMLSVVEHRRDGGTAPELKPWTPVAEASLPAAPSTLTAEEIRTLEGRLGTIGGAEPMNFNGTDFANANRTVVYPVRGKRIYCELGSVS
jgi:hypothetical protein